MREHEVGLKTFGLQTRGREHDLLGASAFRLEPSRKRMSGGDETGTRIASDGDGVRVGGTLRADRRHRPDVETLQLRRDMTELRGEIVVNK